MSSITISMTRTQYLGDSLEVTLAGESDVEDCPICLEKMEPGQMVAVAHDEHVFHHSCITAWLNEEDNHTCPMCRRDLFAPDPKPVEITDALSLSEIRGTLGHHYQIALREQSSGEPWSPILEQWWKDVTAELVRALRDRAENWINGILVRDLEYAFPQGNDPGLGLSHLTDEELDQDHRLDCEPMILALWVQLWSHVRHPRTINGRVSVLQHPLVSAIIFDTMLALQRWHGTVKSPSMLEACLKLRWKAWWRANPDEDRPEAMGNVEAELRVSLMRLLAGKEVNVAGQSVHQLGRLQGTHAVLFEQ